MLTRLLLGAAAAGVALFLLLGAGDRAVVDTSEVAQTVIPASPAEASSSAVASAEADGEGGTPTEPTVEGAVDREEGPLVTRVVDGDTIQLENGQTVRYIGVDTPESVHPRVGVECFGKEASLKNEELVLGKRVQLEKDVSETDRYGRLLRYVYVDGVFINDELVRQGYANSLSYPPDVKYQDDFRTAESEARNASRGLWGSCNVSPPYQGGDEEGVDSGSEPFDSAHSSTSSEQAGSAQGDSTACRVKANINSKGEKIYHLPGCGSYDKTSIDPARGEQYFCSEQEAESQGWRKAGNC